MCVHANKTTLSRNIYIRLTINSQTLEQSMSFTGPHNIGLMTRNINSNSKMGIKGNVSMWGGRFKERPAEGSKQLISWSWNKFCSENEASNIIASFSPHHTLMQSHDNKRRVEVSDENKSTTANDVSTTQKNT